MSPKTLIEMEPTTRLKLSQLGNKPADQTLNDGLSDNIIRSISSEPTFLSTAHADYLGHGLNTIPAGSFTKGPSGKYDVWDSKKPAIAWLDRQQKLNTEHLDYTSYAASPTETVGIGVVTGKSSGGKEGYGLEVLDIDTKNDPDGLIEAEIDSKLQQYLPEIYPTLVKLRTPSGGIHYLYRSPVIEACTKLAHHTDGGDIIETRGQGGYAKTYPSKGYDLLQNNMEQIPFITEGNRNLIVSIAKGCTRMEAKAEVERYVKPKVNYGDDDPTSTFGEFKAVNSIEQLLIEQNWDILETDHTGRTFVRRPGSEAAQSGNIKDGVLYLFTDGSVFDVDTGYNLIQTWMTLNSINLDLAGYNQAGLELSQLGYGPRREVPVEPKVIDVDANIVDTDDVFADLEKFLVSGRPKGFTIGIPSFDNVFSTYTKQFITVTGAPGSGKSDWVDQMCIGYNKVYDWNIAYLSPENEPHDVHVDKLMRKWMGKSIDRDDINSPKYLECKERFRKHFTLIKSDNVRTLDKALTMAQKLVDKRSIKCLVIDPYNKITLPAHLRSKSGNLNEDTAMYLNMIDAFAKKNDILIILVAHPVKLPKNDKGDYLEPDFYSVKGGGEFYDMSYHGLVVHRPFSRSDYKNPTVNIKVLKCKFAHLGINNADTELEWDYLSGLYDTATGHKVRMSQTDPALLREIQGKKPITANEAFGETDLPF